MPDGASLNLRAGEIVEVRSRSEILATLDAHGRRDALPFMPEMLQYCGKRFRVYKRADKTCDTIRRPASLRMTSAVHLEGVRCDGAAHAGCQAGCLVFWKEAWLKRVDPATPPHSYGDPSPCAPPSARGACTEETLFRATRRESQAADGGDLISCQATELPRATSPLPWWDVRQYVRDVASGNIGFSELAQGLTTAAFNMLIRNVRRGILALRPRAVAQPLVQAAASGASTPVSLGVAPTGSRGGPLVGALKFAVHNVLVEYPHIRGELHRTPSAALNLQPGELVQIKSKAEILATLDVNSRNRGLLFDVEMVPYCGGTYRVLRRVERIVDEKTGRMMTFSNPSIVLEGVFCRACLSRNRLFCPRSIYSYWREVWLRRAG